jgi:N-acetylglutamate synthase-like GNAT family acetyltransferase
MYVRLRPVEPKDADACARICYEAFSTISRQHNFPPDMPAVEDAKRFLNAILSNPNFYGVVAEADGRLVGSNFLDERASVVGLGPITVDTQVQNSRIGRELMEHCLARAWSQGRPSVRLVQAAFHNRSLSLYAKLGFEVREPLSCVQGKPVNKRIAGYTVRRATDTDLDACAELCRRVHGYDRRQELADAIEAQTATVVEHDGRITGYATIIGFAGHAVGETNADLKALIGAASGYLGPGFLLPTRNGELFRWCLEEGLRVVQPMTYMSIGLYNEPQGAYLPSILL